MLSTPNRSSFNTGFTLLELLMALSLSALLLVTLAIGINLVLKEWERTDSYLDERLDKTLFLLQIERALSAAFPHTYKDEKENKTYIFFEGKENEIKWISTISPDKKYGLTAWQLLPSEEAESGLEIRTVPAFTDDPSERLKETDHKSLVFEGYTVSFEYLYVEDRKPDEGKWFDEWSGEEVQGLPYAVRMYLEKKEEPKRQFEIIAPIFANEHATIKLRKPNN
jgi:prepilin-type N-terminal cleavage/methylation domain-containing protein